MSIYKDKKRGCYVFDFDRFIEGQRVRARKSLPKTWTRAQADAYDRQESARLYAVATGVERPEHLIDEAVAIYVKHRVPKLKTGKNVIGELAQMYWAFQGKPLSSLPDVCREYAAKAAKASGDPLAPATIKNRIRYLTSACRFAWKHYGMGEGDPGERVVAPTVRNERRYFASREQMLMIARACRCRSARAAIRRAFYSGMRISEILRAEVVSGMFVLHDSKNDDPRIVPMHPKVRCTLKVPMRDRYWISKRFKEAAKSVGLGDLTFHDLRHSAASAMINEGVDLYTVGAVLGHRSPASTKRYAHLATDSLRDALLKIGKKSPEAKTKKAA